MNTKTLIDAVDVELFMGRIDLPRLGISRLIDGRWSASCYWPNGDVIRDQVCHGHDTTLSGAIEKMLSKVEIAKNEVVKLATAAECKAAVQALIREHNAAPDDFVAAVDAILVK